MSCPDWSRLAQGLDTAAGEAAWDDALLHFDDCSLCRDEALRAEPTLMFRALPRRETTDFEVAAMRQDVLALCRAHKLERRERPRGRVQWLRLAAILTALVGATLLGGMLFDASRPEAVTAGAPAAGAPVPSVPVPTSPAAGVPVPSRPVPSVPAAGVPAIDLSHIPLIEDVDPALGALVQLDDHDVSIVMVLADATGNGHV